MFGCKKVIMIDNNRIIFDTDYKSAIDSNKQVIGAYNQFMVEYTQRKDKYFYNIILIASGAIVLSANLVNSDKFTDYKTLLVISWCTLFLSIVLSFLRNYFHAVCGQYEIGKKYSTSCINLYKKTIVGINSGYVEKGNNDKDLFKIIEEHQKYVENLTKKENLKIKISLFSHVASQILFFFGLAFLVIFASLNL